MFDYTIRIGLGISAFALLAGCGANYTVTGHAESAAFARPSCRIIVAPIQASALIVGGKTEGAYLADKKDRSVASYESDKSASAEQFRDKLMAKNGVAFAPGAPESTFTIRPTWTSWEPGYYAGMFSKPGVVHLMLDVVAADGKTVDQVSVEARAMDYATGSRMREALGNAGAGVSNYIADNWKCAR
jgi:hypothetical protein